MKALIMDNMAIDRAVTRISHEIIEKNKGVDNLAIVGIKTRGIFLGLRIAKKINEIEQTNVKFYTIDVTKYRDDLKEGSPSNSAAKESSSGLDIVFVDNNIEDKHIEFEGKRIVLVDDVLYTGRTIRAALNAILGFGRPSSIQLAVLIDRGHRELPIRADYVGKNVPTSAEEKVKVFMEPFDDKNEVVIY